MTLALPHMESLETTNRTEAGKEVQEASCMIARSSKPTREGKVIGLKELYKISVSVHDVSLPIAAPQSEPGHGPVAYPALHGRLLHSRWATRVKCCWGEKHRAGERERNTGQEKELHDLNIQSAIGPQLILLALPLS